MQRYRRFFAAGLWLVVTTAATAMVWMATSIVAAEVTDRPPPVIGRREVVMALESGTSEDATDPGIVTPQAEAPPPTAPAPGASSSGLGSPTAPAPAGPPPPAAPGAAITVPPAVTPTTVPPSPPTTTPPSRPTATYSTAGGTVTVACDGYFIDLVSATPKVGYRARVVTGGPYYVEVHFLRGGQDVPIWAFCTGQPVRVDTPGAGGWWPWSFS